MHLFFICWRSTTRQCTSLVMRMLGIRFPPPAPTKFCRYRITAITPVFQTGDAGSAPATCSMGILAHFVIPFCSPSWRSLSRGSFFFVCLGGKRSYFQIYFRFWKFLVENSKILCYNLYINLKGIEGYDK